MRVFFFSFSLAHLGWFLRSRVWVAGRGDCWGGGEEGGVVVGRVEWRWGQGLLWWCVLGLEWGFQLWGVWGCGNVFVQERRF
jgi:hypothetical protein